MKTSSSQRIGAFLLAVAPVLTTLSLLYLSTQKACSDLAVVLATGLFLAIFTAILSLPLPQLPWKPIAIPFWGESLLAVALLAAVTAVAEASLWKDEKPISLLVVCILAVPPALWLFRTFRRAIRSSGLDGEQAMRSPINATGLGLLSFGFSFCIVKTLIAAWHYPLACRELLRGWIAFAAQNLVRIQVNPGAIVNGLVYVALLILLLHAFAAWLYRSMASPAETPPRRWRVRWTLSLVAAVGLTFVVGYSTIALARHVGWMLSSQDPVMHEKVVRHYEYDW